MNCWLCSCSQYLGSFQQYTRAAVACVLLVCKDPRSFSARLLHCQLSPSLCGCLGLFHPSCRTLRLSLSNFTRWCWPLSPACRGPCEWQPCPPMPPTLFSCRPQAYCEYSLLLSRLLATLLSGLGPSIDLWWMPPGMTSLELERALR